MSLQDQHYIGATLGACDVKVTHSTQGIAIEVDAKRPREDGEDPAEAAVRSVEWAMAAYDAAVQALADRGLAAGPFRKAEVKP